MKTKIVTPLIFTFFAFSYMAVAVLGNPVDDYDTTSVKDALTRVISDSNAPKAPNTVSVLDPVEPNEPKNTPIDFNDLIPNRDNESGLTLVELVKTIQPAVATIISFDEDDNPIGQGSGFFIDDKGHLITNQHVIEGAYSATVKIADGATYPSVGVLTADSNSDIVKLLINTSGNTTPYITPVNVTPLVAEDIVVVGSPFGLESTVSKGIVSAVRKIPTFGNILQISAPISSGSSGSPVLNMQGQVIGVATFIVTEGQALNFAVPSEKILWLKNYPEIIPFPRYKERMIIERALEAKREHAIYKKELFRKAEEGDPEAMFELGKIYLIGRGDIVKDHSKALEWLKKSAEAGYSYAMLELAHIYKRGNAIPENETKAIEWLRKSAEAGNGIAMCILAAIYLEGEIIAKDETQAKKWMNRGLNILKQAAERENCEAIYMLGMIHQSVIFQGWSNQKTFTTGQVFGSHWYDIEYPGLHKDTNKAAKWYKMAASVYEKRAAAGDTEAMYWFGQMCERGEGVERDAMKAVYWYQKASEAGDPRAMCELASSYTNMFSDMPINEAKALEWYLKAVKITQDASTMSKIANLYYRGESITKDSAQAIEWYKKAFETSPSSQAWSAYNIGNIYSKGDGVPRNAVEASKWYTLAAKNGFEYAMLILGSKYYYGEGVQRDYDKAFEWISKAAEEDILYEARIFLAILYHTGHGVDKDDSKSFFWLVDKKPSWVNGLRIEFDSIKDVNEILDLYQMAAEKGDGSANLALGEIHYWGNIVPKDSEEAVRWYLKAAEMGESEAMYSLGFLYEVGEGVAKDFLKSMEWYSRAAEAGHIVSMVELGWAYHKTEDFVNAFKWFYKAAEQGDSDAMRMIGFMYSEGQGVHQNKHEAILWWRKAADEGNTIAMWALGQAYENGEGVIQDYQETLTWYSKGAEAGDTTSMFLLASMYSKGRGVAIDHTKAVEWWRKGAEKEHTGCMSNLGWAYLYGRGVQRDRDQAVRWFQRAARLGNEYSKKQLVRLGEIW